MNITIESFTKTRPHIWVEVGLPYGEDVRELKLDMDDFHDFLERQDRLDFVRDTSDHNGEHIQESGKIEMDEYWELPSSHIEADLKDYIECTEYGVKIWDDIQKGIRSICNDHRKAI